MLVQYVPHRSNPHFILTSFLAGKSCADLYKKGATKDGIYITDVQGEFKVRCDMTTSSGGWTIFQRRIDGSGDLYLGWNNYTEGFGNFSGEFWLILDKNYTSIVKEWSKCFES